MIITHRNKDFKRSWEYVNANKTPIDLTGAYAEFVIQDKTFPTVSLVVFDSSEHITLSGTTGQINLWVPGSVFDLDAGEYAYFLRVVLADGQSVLLEKSFMQVLYLTDLPVIP